MMRTITERTIALFLAVVISSGAFNTLIV
ncbi:hypothetical protein NAP1_14363 [Erythrobacter sp. NAP1]|nr:hypothetical protein NAP1_14363 [Erythrobacter sp. NAP1]